MWNPYPGNNRYGIKATALFDSKLAYTYDWRSVKTLGIPVSSPVKFAYQLMINEVMAPAAQQLRITRRGVLRVV